MLRVPPLRIRYLGCGELGSGLAEPDSFQRDITGTVLSRYMFMVKVQEYIVCYNNYRNVFITSEQFQRSIIKDLKL